MSYRRWVERAERGGRPPPGRRPGRRPSRPSCPRPPSRRRRAPADGGPESLLDGKVAPGARTRGPPPGGRGRPGPGNAGLPRRPRVRGAPRPPPAPPAGPGPRAATRLTGRCSSGAPRAERPAGAGRSTGPGPRASRRTRPSRSRRPAAPRPARPCREAAADERLPVPGRKVAVPQGRRRRRRTLGLTTSLLGPPFRKPGAKKSSPQPRRGEGQPEEPGRAHGGAEAGDPRGLRPVRHRWLRNH